MLTFKNIFLGARFKPVTTITSSLSGQVQTLSSDSKTYLHNGTTASPIVTESQTATLTNKSFDANGTGNSISNLEVADLAAGVLNTSTTLASASNSQVPSALAVKTYVDDSIPSLATVVNGPASATDNAIARFDSTTGKLIQNSVVTVSDTGIIAGSSIDADTNTITNIEDADIKVGAAIDASKIANGLVSNAEFQYLDGVTSAIQTQINAKQSTLVNSAGLAAALSDETGTGLVVFNNSPTLTNASVQTPSRLDMKQDTLANLTTYALTASNGQLVYSTDTKETFVVKDTQLSPVGSGSGSGGINYITNYTADTNTNGWATYADAAGTAPVDGTGGSPTVTFTRTTSAPLRGTASFLYTKPASNVQGQGFSYDFTIDAADQGKVLQGSFDYQIASGTFADDALSVWIYDITNTRMIQPAPYLLKNSTIIEKFAVEFQTASNSTSYRLIVHQGSTSAVANTLKFDNFNFGPQAKLYGSAVTDWVTYVPAITNGGTTTFNSARYRMIGDSVEISGIAKFSTTGAAGALQFSLPTGMQLDTSKIPSTVSDGIVSGGAAWFDSGTAEKPGVAVMVSSTTFALYTDAGIQSPLQGNVLANGDFIRYFIVAPISGKSSTQIMNSDADTRVVTARYGATTSTITSSASIIRFSTMVNDESALYSSGTGLFTIRTPGKYRINSHLRIPGGYALNNTVNIYVYKNGASVSRSVMAAGGAVGELDPYIDAIISCVAGDTLAIYADSTASGPSLSNDVTTTNVNLERISGPSQIMASETVAALYKGQPPTGTLNGSFNIITFGTRIKDSHLAYSSGSYTIPISGTYDISATIAVIATFALNNSAGLSVFIDGIEAYTKYTQAGGAQTVLYPDVSVKAVPLLAGQVVSIRSISNATSPSYSSSGVFNFFSLTRSGNY